MSSICAVPATSIRLYNPRNQPILLPNGSMQRFPWLRHADPCCLAEWRLSLVSVTTLSKELADGDRIRVKHEKSTTLGPQICLTGIRKSEHVGNLSILKYTFYVFCLQWSLMVSCLLDILFGSMTCSWYFVSSENSCDRTLWGIHLTTRYRSTLANK